MKPNVLLIVLDAVRAKNCSLYGHVNKTTPFLESFSNTATTYKQARSPGTNSISSHTSIFTGYSVAEHNATNHEAKIDSEATIWKTLSEEHNYETGLFTPNLIVAEASNLGEAFETVEAPTSRAMNLRRRKLFEDAYGPTDIESSESILDNFNRALNDQTPLRALGNCGWRFVVDLEQSYRPNTEHKVQPAQKYANNFLDWHKKQDSHWAACLNFMDAHRPYKPKSEFNKWGGEELGKIHDSLKAYHDVLGDEPWWKLKAIEALYDGGIRQADDAIEGIISELKDRGEFDNTMIVITSDHGQGFGERSHIDRKARMIKHSWGVHEVLTHVPLVVKYPGQMDKKTVDNLATLQNFPDAVSNVIEGRKNGDSFIADKPILVSTNNLPENKSHLLPDSEMIPHLIGPWRAVYEDVGGGDVIKYVWRAGSSAKVRIFNERESHLEKTSDDGIVEEEFESVTSKNVHKGEKNQVSEEVNERLQELGYIRE